MNFNENLVEPATELERLEINRRIDICRGIKARSVGLYKMLKVLDVQIDKETTNSNKDLFFAVVLFVIWAALFAFIGDAKSWGYVIIGLLAFFGVYRQIIKQGLAAKRDGYEEKLRDLAMLWAAHGATNFASIRSIIKFSDKSGEEEDADSKTKEAEWWEHQIAHIVHSVCGSHRGQSLIEKSRKSNEVDLKESLKRMNKIIENMDAEAT